MNISELKLELIAKISATNDVVLLNTIKEIMDSYKENQFISEPISNYEKTRIFSVNEQRKINLAIQQYENGECISDEEAQKEIQEWLED